MTKFTCLDVMKAAGLEGRRRGKEQAFHCPRHEDEKPSLTVNPDKDVWMCGPCDQDGTAWQLAAFVVGCDPADKEPVKAWLRDRGLLSGNGHREQASQKPTIACTYAYRDAHGVLLYESVRFIPKDFKRRRPDGNGGYVWNLDGVRLIPYALDRLVDRTPDVFVPEGEKDCEALWSRQAPATCNIGGAGKWLDSYSEQLRTVAGVERAYLLRDHDVPGHRHADQVAASLHRVGIEVRIVLLPGLHDGAPAPNHGRDISHWLETHDIAELKTRAAETPPWIPTPEPQTTSHSAGLDPALLDDVTIVVQEGLQIARDGVPYAVDGIVPALGMVGVQVAFSKVGKTTSGQQLGGAVACGTPFLGRATRPTRVLILAAEDPARVHRLPRAASDGSARGPTDLLPASDPTEHRRTRTDRRHGTGGRLRPGPDRLMAIGGRNPDPRRKRQRRRRAGDGSGEGAARATGIPWLIDAHSGKGEDQRDDADPTRALRGASSAAGAADFILSLRYAGGPFGTKRRLSGKGRFVSFAPILMEFDPPTGTFTALGSTKTAMVETTWQTIVETGALTTTPQGASAIAVRAGLAPDVRSVSGGGRRHIDNALRKRPGVRIITESRGNRTHTKYTLEESAADE